MSVGGKPLLLHVLAAARQLHPSRVAVIIGHGADAVRQAYPGDDVSWVVQEQQLGTGHAVLCAREIFHDFGGDVIILSGDVPLIKASTLQNMVEFHRREQAAVTLLTAILDDPTGLWAHFAQPRRRDRRHRRRKRRHCSSRDKLAKSMPAFMSRRRSFCLRLLTEVKNHNQQGEYYLPDIVAIGLEQGKPIQTARVEDAREMMGVNTRQELAFMEKNLRESINQKWMAAGVTLRDPDTTYIDADVSIGKDTVIGPNTHLKGKTTIGERCQIDGSAFLTDMEIGDEVVLKFSVVLTGSRIDRGAIIGPFAHLRPGTHLGCNVHIGNFVEAKAAHVGDGTKANHLTYLGDVTIGRDTNIGAGTITCNYDGFQKYQTTIGDRVQVGSDTTLVAPIALGDDVYVATASTVRHDVPAGALVFNDREERVREGWTEQKRRKMKGNEK